MLLPQTNMVMKSSKDCKSQEADEAFATSTLVQIK